MSHPDPAPATLPFEKFWAWLQGHYNCILRAGTPDVVLFDHDDFHWHLSAEPEEGLVILQLVQGKELVGEIVMAPSEIAYVQSEAVEAEEVVFECVVESQASREVAYHVVLSHGYEEAEAAGPRARWTH